MSIMLLMGILFNVWNVSVLAESVRSIRMGRSYTAS